MGPGEASPARPVGPGYRQDVARGRVGLRPIRPRPCAKGGTSQEMTVAIAVPRGLTRLLGRPSPEAVDQRRWGKFGVTPGGVTPNEYGCGRNHFEDKNEDGLVREPQERESAEKSRG